MSEHRDQVPLHDILRAAGFIVRFVDETDADDFKTNELAKSAILHQFLVLGEATKRLPGAFRDRYPHLPWRQMAGIRDQLIHEYDTVDLDVGNPGKLNCSILTAPREQRFDTSQEIRNVTCRRIPNRVEVNYIIPVNESVSHACHVFPGNGRIFPSELRRQTLHSFAEHKKLMEDGGLMERTLLKPPPVDLFCELNDQTRRLCNVQKMGCVVRLHWAV